MLRFFFWLFCNRLVIGLCALGFVAAGAAGLAIIYYNALFSLSRLASLFHYSTSVPGVETIPPEILPLMQDLSLASPSLIAFTLFCAGFAGFRLLPDSDGSFAGSHFPFPESYKTYFIQIGLLGTIVGFVIAFSALEPGSRGQADILLAALGTALWSTLTAILLAYIICPLLELLFQWWLRRRTGRDGEPDTLSVIEELRQRTIDASDSLGRFSGLVNRLNLEMDTLELKNRLVQMESNLQRLNADVATMSEALETTTTTKTDLQTRMIAVERKIDDSDRSLSAVMKKSSIIEKEHVMSQQRIDELEKTLQKLLRQLRQVFD